MSDSNDRSIAAGVGIIVADTDGSSIATVSYGALTIASVVGKCTVGELNDRCVVYFCG